MSNGEILIDLGSEDEYNQSSCRIALKRKYCPACHPCHVQRLEEYWDIKAECEPWRHISLPVVTANAANSARVHSQKITDHVIPFVRAAVERYCTRFDNSFSKTTQTRWFARFFFPFFQNVLWFSSHPDWKRRFQAATMQVAGPPKPSRVCQDTGLKIDGCRVRRIDWSLKWICMNVMDFRLNGVRIPSTSDILVTFPEERMLAVYHFEAWNPDGYMNDTALIEPFSSKNLKTTMALNSHGMMKPSPYHFHST
jgi:hypothetical protein